MKARDLVENYGDFFDEVKSLKKEIDKKCSYTKPQRFKQLDSFFIRWRDFFIGEKHCKKTDTILDFGCASGFSIFTGRKFGYNKIFGIDVKNEFYDSVMKYVIKIIDTEDNIVFYKGGGNLPFEDNYFDIILSVSAITKDFGYLGSIENPLRANRLKKRIKELVRISRESAKWYIRPDSHLKYIKNTYGYLGLTKNIKFKELHSFGDNL